MELTVKDREFLQAVARGSLPRYDSMAALKQKAARLVRMGLLESFQEHDWTRYELTSEGKAQI